MKIVKFKNGKFGVRRGFMPGFYSFLDMKDGEFWWSIQSHVKTYAQTDSELVARGWMPAKTWKRDWGTPI